MIAIIESKKDELIALCRKYGVRTLELFGSATSERFDPETSDLDFLVEYSESPPASHVDCYFGLKFDLEDLFGRSIDLVETGAIRNPYFLRSVNKSRMVLYAA